MLHKAFDLGVQLQCYVTAVRNHSETAFTPRHLSELKGLCSACGVAFATLSPGDDLGSVAVDYSHQLRTRFDESTAAAFRLGFILPSLGQEPTPSGVSAVIEK